MKIWKYLDSIEDLNTLDTLSNSKFILIYKHSPICTLSSIVRKRLEQSWDFDFEKIEAVFINVIKDRQLSNAIEAHYQIRHESPQILLIKSEKCIYEESHFGIDLNSLGEIIYGQAG